MAMALAETERDTYNLIICRNNFGAMFKLLEEYELAFDYYNQARSLFRSSGSEIDLHMIVLNNIADLLVAKNDSVQFKEIIQEANGLMKFADLPPYREAELLHNLGSMYKNAKKYSDAIKYFREADSIYSKNGFLQFDLRTRIDIVDCLIGLSKFIEAKTMIPQIESLSEKINDVEGVIDAVSRFAQIQYREGNLANAVESSNYFLNKIEKMSSPSIT
jgi:tetratricopeptide (TPR) repeat protein